MSSSSIQYIYISLLKYGRRAEMRSHLRRNEDEICLGIIDPIDKSDSFATLRPGKIPDTIERIYAHMLKYGNYGAQAEMIDGREIEVRIFLIDPEWLDAPVVYKLGCSE